VDAPSFEYEVAISFHSLDEGLATELCDLVQKSSKTFLYSKKQEVLAGTDGETTFNRVFGEQTRLVVVFVRKEWGETPFTRIEQTAIRNRAFDSGYDFTFFIPTDACKLPSWVPKNRIWCALDRFGLEGAAGAIEMRLQELGGEPTVESTIDRAARFQRAREFDAVREKFDHSIEGVEQADQAFTSLVEDIAGLASELSTTGGHLRNLRVIKNGQMHECALGGLGIEMKLYWYRPYANVLRGNELTVRIFGRAVSRLDPFASDKPSCLHTKKFEYLMLGMERFGYVDTANKRRAYTDDTLSAYLIKLYLDTFESRAHSNVGI
jgi:hypothetical protein